MRIVSIHTEKPDLFRKVKKKFQIFFLFCNYDLLNDKTFDTKKEKNHSLK
jgi:hypothetical protein